MNFLLRLERRFGHIGIPNLMLYVVTGRGLAWLLSLSDPTFPQHLELDALAVRRGEIWRLVTYVFMPNQGGPLFVLLALYSIYWIGALVEAMWGTFRFTLFYFIGFLTNAAAFVVFGWHDGRPFWLDTSLFLAAATLVPDMTILLFILPVKMKWLGWLDAAFLAVTIVGSDTATRISVLIAFANYVIFFWPEILGTPARVRSAFGGRPVAGPPPPPERPGPVHRCTACGKTERDDPKLEFRWCSCERCGEGREYCVEHLREHLQPRARA